MPVFVPVYYNNKGEGIRIWGTDIVIKENEVSEEDWQKLKSYIELKEN